MAKIVTMAENKISLEGLNEKCENILSQDQIGLPKPHVLVKSAKIIYRMDLTDMIRSVKKYIISKLILPNFESKTHYFQSPTR